MLFFPRFITFDAEFPLVCEGFLQKEKVHFSFISVPDFLLDFDTN